LEVGSGLTYWDGNKNGLVVLSQGYEAMAEAIAQSVGIDTARQAILKGGANKKSWDQVFADIGENNRGYENFLRDGVRGCNKIPKNLNIWLDILRNSTHSIEAMRTLTQFLGYSTPQTEQYVNQYHDPSKYRNMTWLLGEILPHYFAVKKHYYRKFLQE
jgi:hypothetical protein